MTKEFNSSVLQMYLYIFKNDFLHSSFKYLSEKIQSVTYKYNSPFCQELFSSCDIQIESVWNEKSRLIYIEKKTDRI